jgi:hypothetical protein
VDEHKRLEQASGEGLRRGDFKEYDRLQAEQKKRILGVDLPRYLQKNSRFLPFMATFRYLNLP